MTVNIHKAIPISSFKIESFSDYMLKIIHKVDKLTQKSNYLVKKASLPNIEGIFRNAKDKEHKILETAIVVTML